MTFDGKREFYHVTKISLYLPFTSNYFYKKSSFTAVFFIRISLHSFHLLIFYLGKSST